MIVNKSEYNPLGAIFKILDGPLLNTSALFEIKAELFKGGVVPENGDEFNTILELLVEYNKGNNGN